MKNTDNKLKKFGKKHELAFAIAGGAVILIAGVGIGYYVCRKSPSTINREFDRLVTRKVLERWLSVIEKCQEGTRSTSICNYDGMTVADCFGKHAVEFIADSEIQPDDLVVNIIYNIAKKAET